MVAGHPAPRGKFLGSASVVGPHEHVMWGVVLSSGRRESNQNFGTTCTAGIDERATLRCSGVIHPCDPIRHCERGACRASSLSTAVHRCVVQPTQRVLRRSLPLDPTGEIVEFLPEFQHCATTATPQLPACRQAGNPVTDCCQTRRTLAALGPFGPCVTSYSTLSFSFRLL